MNCKQMETQLLACLDERANTTERREVEEHIAACEACRARVEGYRRLWALLDEAPVMEPTPAFAARLRARIATEPPRPTLWAWLAPSPRLAFAVSLLLVLSIWISTRPPAPVRVQASEAEFKMIEDLPVLEDYDVLANFEALSEIRPKTEDR